jgi:hypothetical protein
MPIKGADMGRCFMMLSFKRWFREPVAWRGGRAPVRSSLNTQLLVDAMAFIPLASEPRDFLTLQSQAGHQSLLSKDEGVDVGLQRGCSQ